MIVNDFENKKTLDTETGAYLTYIGGHGYSETASFKYVDGTTEISFDAHERVEKTSPNETIVTYTLDSPPFFNGGARRNGYVAAIKDALTVFNIAYGGYTKPPKTVACKVVLVEPFISSVEKWENQNG
jgi:hypothetical protein